jgi:glycosyltransferase involved in cell wall biosynthesis
MRLTVVEPDGGGGMIHYAYQMCAALAEEGADVTLITSRHYELAGLPHRFTVDPRMRLWANVKPGRPRRSGPAVSAVLAAGRAVRRVGRGLRYMWEWERLTRHLLRTRPEVVQFGVIRFGFLAFFLRRLQRAGLVLTQVCHEFTERDHRTRRIDDPTVYGVFSAIFLHGEANRSAFLSRFDIPSGRCHVIPHGNEALLTSVADRGGDLRGEYGIRDGRPVALFFGGLRPSKGLEDLIDAFALVRREIEATLLVAGAPQGVEPGALIDRARRLGLARDVVVDGRYLPLEDVGPLLRSGDVVVLPYRTASASGALQAAYAFGKPVIVTEAGALPEAVDPGRTGLVVPVAHPDLLARAIVKILADPAEARRMGMEARVVSERDYSWGPIARAVLAASHEAMREAPR